MPLRIVGNSSPPHIVRWSAYLNNDLLHERVRFLSPRQPLIRTTSTSRALVRRENWVRGDREKDLRNRPSRQR